jgi:para-nitrobenzyl esterase
MYLLEWRSPADGGRIMASHGLDVPLSMDNVERSGAWTADYPQAQVVADAMSEAWLAFARSGNPGHNGIPHWPAYTEGRATMCFDVACQVSADPYGEAALWRDLPDTPVLLPFA